MSAYEQKLREKLGLHTSPLESLSENDVDYILEILNKRISEEDEGMEDSSVEGEVIPNVDDPQNMPSSNPSETTPTTQSPSSQVSTGDITGSIVEEERDQADNIYNEVLQHFREKVSKCEDVKQKGMWRKAYEMCYKMREKFIGEMVAKEQ